MKEKRAKRQASPNITKYDNFLCVHTECKEGDVTKQREDVRLDICATCRITIMCWRVQRPPRPGLFPARQFIVNITTYALCVFTHATVLVALHGIQSSNSTPLGWSRVGIALNNLLCIAHQEIEIIESSCEDGRGGQGGGGHRIRANQQKTWLQGLREGILLSLVGLLLLLRFVSSFISH